MLRVLFVSRNNNAERFQDWAAETLFTVQMGTQEAKDDLASKLGAKTARAVFQKSVINVPMLYLFSLGTAKDLRTSMNISSEYDDNAVICKYGHTANGDTRTY
jgi:protein involved in ribonucleotide reduction